MKLDQGDIFGGFPHAYEAVIVQGPPSPLIAAIERSTGLDRAGRSVTLQVTRDDGSTWLRGFSDNFSPDLLDCIFTLPNAERLGIRVSGVMLVANIADPDDVTTLDLLPLSCSASDIAGERMFSRK